MLKCQKINHETRASYTKNNWVSEWRRKSSSIQESQNRVQYNRKKKTTISKIISNHIDHNNHFDQFCFESIRARWDLISNKANATEFSIDQRFIDCAINIEHLKDAESYFSYIACENWNAKLSNQFVQFRTKQGIFADALCDVQIQSNDHFKPWKFL